jgi:hypothetical protein
MKQWQLDFLKPQSIALTLLLLVQACLLFYNFSNIAISHDELSALYRCRFQTFSELINEGVVVDGHPALVQVILWSLVNFCEASIATVKFPFILFSLVCTFYLFKIGVKYFGIYTALLAGIFFISLEYFLYLQSVARPYSLELMLNLMLVYHLHLFNQKSKKWGRLFFITIITTLSFYTHYFSFLQSLTILFTYLIFQSNQSQKIQLFGVLVLSSLLFLPHLSITLTQISYGGLQWLSKPDWTFFNQFYWQLFNQSTTITVLFSLFIILALVQIKKHFKNRVILLCLWGVPLITIYLYSILRAPVLQSASLCFSTPFLLLLAANGIETLKYKKLKIAGIAISFILLIHHLHYSTHFIQNRFFQPMQAFINSNNSFKEQNPEKKISTYWQGNSNYFKLYLQLTKQTFDCQYTEKTESLDSTQIMQYDYVICNHLQAENMASIGRYFPYIKQKDYHLHYEFVVLQKAKSQQLLYEKTLTFTFDSSNSQVPVTIPIHSIIPNHYYYLDWQKVDNDTIDNELVIETFINNLRVDWRSMNLSQKQTYSIKLKDVLNPQQWQQKPDLKIYLSNPQLVSKKPLQIVLKMRTDNPFEYTGK